MKFTILTGSIKKGGAVLQAGSEVELSAEEAERINKKGLFVELSETRALKIKAEKEAQAAIEKAEKEAAAKLKGGAK